MLMFSHVIVALESRVFHDGTAANHVVLPVVVIIRRFLAILRVVLVETFGVDAIRALEFHPVNLVEGDEERRVLAPNIDVAACEVVGWNDGTMTDRGVEKREKKRHDDAILVGVKPQRGFVVCESHYYYCCCCCF